MPRKGRSSLPPWREEPDVGGAVIDVGLVGDLYDVATPELPPALLAPDSGTDSHHAGVGCRGNLLHDEFFPLTQPSCLSRLGVMVPITALTS